MDSPRSSRLEIADLPLAAELTPEQLAALFGAGKRPAQTHLGVEALEAREVMAANLMASLNDGALRVQGTEQSDHIRLLQAGDRIEVYNGTTGALVGSAAASAVSQVMIEALAGADTITLDPSVRVAAFIHGGAGNDRFEIPSGSSAVKDFQNGDVIVPLGAAATTRAASSATQDGLSLAGTMESVDRLLNKEIIAYNFTTPGTLDLNLLSQTYYADIDLGDGVKIDSTQFSRLLKSAIENGGTPSIPLPQVDPLKAAASISGLKMTSESNYREARQEIYDRYGAENVYFASERFVNWASPETVSRLTAMIVGGTVTGQGWIAQSAIDEAKSMLLLEVSEMVAWFKANSRAPNDAVPEYPLMAGKLLQSLWNGIVQQSTTQNLPEGTILGTVESLLDASVRATGATERHQMELPGISSAGDTITFHTLPIHYQASLETRVGGAEVGEVSTPNHLGAFLVWGHDGPSKDKVNPITRALEKDGNGEYRFDTDKQTSWKDTVLGAGADAALELDFWKGLLAQGALTPQEQADYESAVASMITSAAEKVVFKGLANVLSISGSDLDERNQEGNPLVDLTNTDVSRDLEKFLSFLAQGNRSSVKIKQLEVNLTNYSVSVKFDLNHKHSWGSVNDIAGEMFDTLADWGEKGLTMTADAAEAIGKQVDQWLTQQNRALNDLAEQTTEKLKALNKAIVKEQRQFLKDTEKALDRFEDRAIDGFEDFTGDYKERITSWLRSTKDDLDGYFDKLDSLSSKASKEAQRWADSASKSVDKLLNQNLNRLSGGPFAEVSKVLRGVNDQIRRATDVAGDVVEDALDSVNRAISAATREARSSLNSINKALTRALDASANEFKALLKPALREVKSLVSKSLAVADKALDAQMKAMDKTLDTALDGVKATIKAETQVARTAFKLQADAVKKAAREGARFLREDLRELLQQGREEIVKSLSQQADAVADLEAYKRQIMNRVLKSVQAEFQQKLTAYKQANTQALKQAQEATKNVLGDAKKALDRALEGVDRKFDQALDQAKKAFNQAWNDVQKKINSQIADAKEEVRDAFSDAKTAGSKAVKDAKSRAQSVLDGLKDRFDRKLSDAKDSANRALERARNSINDLIARGRDQIRGIENRIREEAERIRRAAEEAARQAAAAAEAARQAAAAAAQQAANAVTNVVKKIKKPW